MAEPSSQEEMIREAYRLSKDNNRMLRGMRRNAMIGGFIRFLFWIAVVIVPLWFYMTYLAPVMQQVTNQMQAMANTGNKASVDLNSAMQKLKDFLPGSSQ